ncbi:[SSU ribosomal protein S18P]-alanine acetyltransferase [Geothermobacter ehrlichii]|uniref:[Ribosomal protein bS18]-alanine N-acetyltransferase n=2 Tax=Geothermobacter ehrlichii TaxID=213224 RepID=A0A5D3WNF5_9BACT|nr:[SSU ribosomal protein S18P]-alanine acetyltransferase [Geothermobacter ehrlichii]
MPVAIRPMTRSDIEQVTLIERACQPHPWDAGIFRRELDNPDARLVVAETAGCVAAFLVSWQVLDEVEIHNVCVAPAFRRQGLARALLTDLFTATEGARHFLEVRVGNLPAVRLYESLGFVRQAVRRRYYHDGEDALVMVREAGAAGIRP